jgi:plastocyanin
VEDQVSLNQDLANMLHMIKQVTDFSNNNKKGEWLTNDCDEDYYCSSLALVHQPTLRQSHQELQLDRQLSALVFQPFPQLDLLTVSVGTTVEFAPTSTFPDSLSWLLVDRSSVDDFTIDFSRDGDDGLVLQDE